MRHSLLRLVLLLSLLTPFYILLTPSSVSALGLKVAPLLYEEKLSEGEKKKGFVDISNPNDQEVVITTDIQAFRQVNENGDLEFYDKSEYKEGIKLDYERFALKSREAIRLYFLLDANKLPKGGVYATLLFRTTSGDANPDNTSIQPATRVGTHLLIENGGGGTKNAFIKELKVPLFQFGSSVKATTAVSNVGGDKSLAFFPEVSVATDLFGKSARLKAPLVFPGNSRYLNFELPANHFGLTRVAAETGGKTVYAWTFAITGTGRWLGPLFLVAVAILTVFVLKYKKLITELQSIKKSRRK